MSEDQEKVPSNGKDHHQPEANQVQQIQAHYSGPIPPASQFAGYEEVLPGAGERIVKMAEQGQKHAHKIETRGQLLFYASAFFAQLIVLIIGLSSIITGGYLVYSGHDLSGFGTILLGVSAIAGSVFFSRKKDEE